MPIVTLPDGRQANFPDDMPREQIRDMIARKFPDAMPMVDPATNQPAGVPEFVPTGGAAENYDPQTGEVSRYGRGMSAGMGAADALTFGFGDEIGAQLTSGSFLGLTPNLWGDYEKTRDEMRRNATRAQAENPGSYLAGQIGGGVAQAVGTGGAGFGANAIRSGASLARVGGGLAADGVIYGGLQGAGGGTDAQSRAMGAGIGALTGGATGFVSPYAVAGVQAAARPFVSPIMSRLRPAPYAERAMSEGLRRAGQSTDDVADALVRATAEGQDMFNVADAMGHSGQRMLSTVARNPNNMRQPTVDALTSRQMGQGERLANTLAEGFGAPDTAAQRATSQKTARSAAASVNYDAARQGAGVVNLTPTINTIDALMKRNPILGDSALTKTEIGSRLSRLRSQMTAKGEQLIDFDTVLNLKQDLYATMKALKTSGKSVPDELSKVYDGLDAALEKSSQWYRAANDTYRVQSQAIDAIDAGKNAQSGRVRASDSIPAFNRLTPNGQNNWRAGYVDPLIAKVESNSISPTTNKARPLMTGKTAQEFPAFAVPGRADQMGSRIAREQRMFETANTALGGSKTADNLADAAEMAKFDPGVIMSLVQGRPLKAAVDGVASLLRESQGMSPGVIERVAVMLLETRPDVARAMLNQAMQRGAVADGRRALANAILRNMGGVAGKNLAAMQSRTQ